MDIPLIRKFACGYVGGGQSGDAPTATVIAEHDRQATGSCVERPGAAAASWPGARSTGGPTSIYHAAGGTGVGVLQCGGGRGCKLGIGVDSNQNAHAPGPGADLDGQGVSTTRSTATFTDAQERAMFEPRPRGSTAWRN